MQEFSSISVSSYEAGSLAEQLTERSRDGWSVVAIVPTGSTVTAYLARDTDGAPSPASDPSVGGTAPEPTPRPAAEPATEPAPAAVVPDASPGWAAGATASEPAPAADPAAGTAVTPDDTRAETTDETTADTTADAASAGSSSTAQSGGGAAGAAPAGWYADPSGRFELRYWDGGQWTEHVSRAGQQYTDPPVA